MVIEFRATRYAVVFFALVEFLAVEFLADVFASAANDICTRQCENAKMATAARITAGFCNGRFVGEVACIILNPRAWAALKLRRKPYFLILPQLSTCSQQPVVVIICRRRL